MEKKEHLFPVYTRVMWCLLGNIVGDVLLLPWKWGNL